MYCAHFFVDAEGTQKPVALIVYNFAGVPEHEVDQAPHGNSKRRVGYVR